MAEQERDPLCAAAKKIFAAPFGALLKLAPDVGPPLWIDGRQTPPQILTEEPNAEADCLWRGAREALARAIASARAFESAYVAGRISIAGDMSAMARIALDESR